MLVPQPGVGVVGKASLHIGLQKEVLEEIGSNADTRSIHHSMVMKISRVIVAKNRVYGV